MGHRELVNLRKWKRRACVWVVEVQGRPGWVEARRYLALMEVF